jgi:uncharacterized phiE125 gp8 family phage protein
MINTPSLTLTATPDVEPLTLDEVKHYLKITDDEDDFLIKTLIDITRRSAEKYLKASIINQVWKLSYDMYAPSLVRLPMGPVQFIWDVTIFAKDETATLIAPNVYYLGADNKKLLFDAVVVGNRVEITYSAGYGHDSSYVPQDIKDGLLSHIAAIYDGAAGGNIIPDKSQTFYNPHRQINR